MDQPISDAMDRSHASLIELLIAHSHQAKGKAPTLQYLTEETFTFIDAGVDTSGRTIAAAIYYIVRNPGVQQKLCAELDEASATDQAGKRVDAKLLGTLPYLVGQLSIYQVRGGTDDCCTECCDQRNSSDVARSSRTVTSYSSC
jgi:cytochrome P450